MYSFIESHSAELLAQYGIKIEAGKSEADGALIIRIETPQFEPSEQPFRIDLNDEEAWPSPPPGMLYIEWEHPYEQHGATTMAQAKTNVCDFGPEDVAHEISEALASMSCRDRMEVVDCILRHCAFDSEPVSAEIQFAEWSLERFVCQFFEALFLSRVWADFGACVRHAKALVDRIVEAGLRTGSRRMRCPGDPARRR